MRRKKTKDHSPRRVTEEGFRRGNEIEDRRAGCAVAKYALHEILSCEPSGKYSWLEQEVDPFGWVRLLGKGLSYDAYHVECTVEHEPELKGANVVVRLPREDAPPGLADRAQREIRVLQYLETQQFPLRLPRIIGVAPTAHGLAVAQEAVFGLPLDLRAGHQH